MAIRIKSELSAGGAKELTKLDKWYCQWRTEPIRPGDPFFAEGVPPEEQGVRSRPRIDKYPKIKARLAKMVESQALGPMTKKQGQFQKLLLLRKLQAWEQHGVGAGGYAAPLAETGGGLMPSDAVIELLDSDDEEGAAAAAAGCSPIEIDNYAEEHWDVLFVRHVKAEAPQAAAAGGAAGAAAAQPAAGPRVKEESAMVAARVAAEAAAQAHEGRLAATAAAAAAAASPPTDTAFFAKRRGEYSHGDCQYGDRQTRHAAISLLAPLHSANTTCACNRGRLLPRQRPQAVLLAPATGRARRGRGRDGCRGRAGNGQCWARRCVPWTNDQRGGAAQPGRVAQEEAAETTAAAAPASKGGQTGQQTAAPPKRQQTAALK